MRLPRRRTIWLSAALFLAVVVGAWLRAPESRIRQANFDRIQGGMNSDEVRAIIGEDEEMCFYSLGQAWMAWEGTSTWREGPNWIAVDFDKGKVTRKHLHRASAWEALTWYAKKGAAKIGVNWD
jgi:hypothetical protein